MARVRRLVLSLTWVLIWGLLVAEALGALTVKFVSVASPVRLGEPARVEVATRPGAVCDIEVRSPRGLVRTAGIRPKRAGGNGRIVWIWRVGKAMAPGRWSVLVDCLLGEQVGVALALFTVK